MHCSAVYVWWSFSAQIRDGVEIEDRYQTSKGESGQNNRVRQLDSLSWRSVSIFVVSNKR